MPQENTTIAAVSTPRGKGGIAVIRISGPDASAVADRIFFPSSGKALSECRTGMMIRGELRDGPETVDDGMAVLFRAPRSYTGEDTAELYCHGGVLLTQTVLSAAYNAGAVPAGPGEYTKRAFLSGKLSLSRAEAVISLIDAENHRQLRLAAASVRGGLSARLDELSAELTELISSLFAAIDFPDEDLASLSDDELKAGITALRKKLEALERTYKEGHAVAEGIPTVLCGLPNAGKSSLLNRILGRERAIVTDIPGTTRDTIEESASFGGATLRLCDTAGIRRASDEAEAQGVERAREALASAELILLLIDGSAEAEEQAEQELLDEVEAQRVRGAEVIPLLTKSDRGTKRGFEGAIAVSAVTGEGMDALEKRIETLFLGEKIGSGDAVIVNARQHSAVCAALECVRRAEAAAADGMTPDALGIDLEAALAALGECDGRAVSEKVVEDIFSRFCVGK